jgi:hypothetical protein
MNKSGIRYGCIEQAMFTALLLGTFVIVLAWLLGCDVAGEILQIVRDLR